MMRRHSRRGMTHTALALAATGAMVLGACGGDDGGGGGGSAADWCTMARAFSESGDVLDSEETDPGTIRDGMREAVRAVEAMERSAPAEIRDDVRQIASGFKAFNDALAKVDYNFFALLTDPEAAAAIEALDTPDFDAAADRIDAYTLRECGFSLDDDGDDPFGDDPIEDNTLDDDPIGADDGDSSDNPFGSDDSVDFGNDEATMQMMAQLYSSMFGITEEQATCFAQQLFASGQEDFDPSVFAGGETPFLSACGLTPEDFATPGG